jgi:hypothetical protein
LDAETNTYLDEIYGRCDRETSCGYFKKPETNFTIENVSIITLVPKKSTNPNEISSFHSKDVLLNSLKQYGNNNLYLYLKTIFSIDEVQKTFEKYKIGSSKTWLGATVFWQIDNLNKIRAGKIFLFDKLTCKRVKEPYAHITWVHKRLSLKPFNLSQCLFGLHLANDCEKIAITESEKTAIIMSLFMPEYKWMATGSKQNFKNDILYPIKSKEIIAFPDKSEFHFWQLKANELNKLGFKITVSDYVEKIDCESGTDLADIYISLKEQKSNISELSNFEKKIVRLASINPELLNLIETFDLCDTFDNPIDIDKLANN